MKVTLDLSKLLEEGAITKEESERLAQLGKKSVSSVAFNLLVGFGVTAVSGGALALFPSAVSAFVLGAILIVLGLAIRSLEEWSLLASISLLIGGLLLGGAILQIDEGSVLAFLVTTVLYAAIGIIGESALLVSLSVLALSSCLGARTDYFHAAYFLGIEEPLLTILFFSALAIGLYYLSLSLRAKYQRLAIAASRTSVFLVNFGFWIGSLWGERDSERGIMLPDEVFAIGWAIALVAAAIWAHKANRLWLLNTVAVFGSIHLYTQWFEFFGASPVTILAAGLLAVFSAVGIWKLNRQGKR